MQRWWMAVTLGAWAMPTGVAAQHEGHTMPAAAAESGWRATWMAQVFPLVTAGAPFGQETHLRLREAYLTQPALMGHLESPGGGVVLHVTGNAEQFTQPDGELTFGGWGEGFIDRRHPHALLHELMASWNVWDAPGGAASLSAGRGFAPYGTEDPMGRPVVKYPTNHHLSQLLERWTVNGVYRHAAGWSAEVGVFGGNEPEDAYDLSNIETFGNSWSGRLTHRLGGMGAAPALEISASYGRVTEEHGDEEETTALMNGALRYGGALGGARAYGLLEASWSDPADGDEEGYWAVLGEGSIAHGPHTPYARVEVATRPEYHRLGAPGTEGFFRYDHDAHADGATRWIITTLGYGYTPQGDGVSTRPFVEVQHHAVRVARGDLDVDVLFGKASFWSVSAGLRVFMGGGPMRMGAYGVLDPMAAMAPAGMDASHMH